MSKKTRDIVIFILETIGLLLVVCSDYETLFGI